MLMTFTLMWRTVVARKEMPLPILMYALFYYYLGTESTIFIGESVNIHLLHLLALLASGLRTTFALNVLQLNLKNTL